MGEKEIAVRVVDLDPWLGADKFYHVVMCLFLTLLFYSLASLIPHPPFLRRHAISIGSIASLLVGAAKEAADQLGYFHSSGASLRDALADLLGVLIASFALSRFKIKTPRLKNINSLV